MSIHHDHDTDAERQVRVDRMIKEFLDAHSRRFGKPNDNVDSMLDVNVRAPRLRTTVSLFCPLRNRG